MANAREIQNRIKSIQDTRKITNAMYLISSTKLKKKQKASGRYRTLFLHPSEPDPAYPAPYGGYRASLF